MELGLCHLRPGLARRLHAVAPGTGWGIRNSRNDGIATSL